MDDSTKMKELLKELNISPTSLSRILGYKNPSSIFNIIYGTKTLKNSSIINRILTEFPQVNVNFLTKGTKPILIEKKKSNNETELLKEISNKLDLIIELIKKAHNN